MADEAALARRTDRSTLVAPIAVGIAVRLALVLAGSRADRFTFADSTSYRIVAGELPSAIWSPGDAVLTATLFRPPGYPAVLALTGGSDHVIAVVLLQCVLGAVAIVWLAHRLAGQLAGPVAAATAAWICALDPASLSHQLLVASETVAAVALLGAAVAAARTVEAVRHGVAPWRTAALVGALAALATLTRPNLVVCLPWFALAVALPRPRRRALAAAAVVLIVGTVPVAAWVVRNDRVAGSPVLSTTFGQNVAELALAAAATDEGRLGGLSVAQEEYDRVTRAMAPRVGLSPPVAGDTASIATDRQWTREGRAILGRHPRGALVVASTGVLRAAGAPGTSLLVEHLPEPVAGPARVPLLVLGSIWVAGLWAAAAIGALELARRRRWSELALLAGTVVLVLVSAAGPWLHPRFRVPIVPLLAVLAGIGVARLLDARAATSTPAIGSEATAT